MWRRIYKILFDNIIKGFTYYVVINKVKKIVMG